MNYKWTAMTVTTIGTLLTGIDARIVVIGLPTVAQQLHASADAVMWITQAYVLAGTVGLLFIGKISDIFGRVRLYNLGFVIFTIGSILCAVALDSYQLIAFRVVQGFGAGILWTSGSAIVTDASPRNELGMMLGINQTAVRLGNIIGLTLSGLILSVVDWRGLFYVNIPIGVFGMIWANRRLREMAVKEPSKKMDWAGFALFSIGLTLILVAVTYMSYGISGFFEGVAMLAVGLVMIAYFVKLESSVSNPVLDLRLFKIRLFAAGNLAQALNALAWMGMLLVMAFYLQVGLGYTPLQAGIGMVPLDVTYFFSSLIGGRLSDRYGTRFLATLGLLMNTLAFFLLATFGAGTAYTDVVLVLVLAGVGNGLFTPPNLRAIMSSVPVNKIGVASAFRNTMFNIGQTLSYGTVMLLITFGIPYGAFSAFLQNLAPQATVQLLRAEFLNGFRIATLFLAVVDAIAIVPSIMRGKETMEWKKIESGAESPVSVDAAARTPPFET